MEWKTEHNGNVIIYPDQNAEKYINISKPTKKRFCVDYNL